MNMELISLQGNTPVTMSSREIAELCEKRHDHVLRDIEKMLADIAHPKFGVSDFTSTYIDSTGRSLKEYRLPKDLTVTLITGYRADLRYKVVKHLEALEAAASKPTVTIDLHDPAQLMPLLASYAQRTQLAEAAVAVMAPKADALDRLDAAEGNMTIRVASKVLGVPERKLSKWLEVNGWAFRQSGKGSMQAYVAKRNAGYLDHKLSQYEDPKTGDEKISCTMVITPKGLAKLAKELPQL